VPSSDLRTVKPCFQGRLDFSPPVPDLSERGWTLIGGRLDYIDGRPVAVLVYRLRMHNMNVFLWPNQGSASSPIRHDDAQGYQILHWNGPEMKSPNSLHLLGLCGAMKPGIRLAFEASATRYRVTWIPLENRLNANLAC
jgi:hypothetical protein